MKFIVIGPKDALAFDDEIDKHPVVFVRFHSPSCGHCTSMKHEMDKLDNHPKIKDLDLGVIDADSSITGNIKHPIGEKQHGKGVPAMFILFPNKPEIEPEEYEGDRTADEMANFIVGKYPMSGGKKIKRYCKMKGGNKPCDASDDFCRRKDGEGECESYMELQHLGADVIMRDYVECEPEQSASSAPVAAEPAPFASKPAASPMQAPQSNFGTYRADDGVGDAPCKTPCGDHGIGHGLASMVGLGHLTHATCEGADKKQHKCKKVQSAGAGKKRKTRKHKKKAKKAHKKKTHKRKPKRKTHKHKKKAKKAHKKKTHKRKHRGHKKK
uniref:Thioredoxin domain-containing protein n=1 Tax=viral metagenome TaxID=1070528 RepID=A0A6C0CQT6_9ZZZZ